MISNDPDLIVSGQRRQSTLRSLLATMALPFLTDYDAVGGAGGSIDPLGALRTYYGLVDLVLPGMTTITTIRDRRPWQPA